MMPTLTTVQLNSPDRYSEIQLRCARSKCSFEMQASVRDEYQATWSWYAHSFLTQQKPKFISRLVVTNLMNIASEFPLKAFFRQWNLKHLKADTGVCKGSI